MVGTSSSSQARIHWLRARGILPTRYLSVAESYCVYRLIVPEAATEEMALANAFSGHGLPPDLYRVRENGSMDSLFKRLVAIGYAEVYCSTYRELTVQD